MEISIRSTGSAKEIPQEAILYVTIQANCSSKGSARDLQAKRCENVRSVMSEFDLSFAHLTPVSIQDITSRQETLDPESKVKETKFEVTAYRAVQFAEIVVREYTAVQLALILERLSNASGSNVATNFVLSEAQRAALHAKALEQSFNEAVASAVTIAKLVYGCQSLNNRQSDLNMRNKKAELLLKSAGMECGVGGYSNNYLFSEEVGLGSLPKSSVVRANITAPVCEPLPVSVTINYVFDTKVGDKD